MALLPKQGRLSYICRKSERCGRGWPACEARLTASVTVGITAVKQEFLPLSGRVGADIWWDSLSQTLL